MTPDLLILFVIILIILWIVCMAIRFGGPDFVDREPKQSRWESSTTNIYYQEGKQGRELRYIPPIIPYEELTLEEIEEELHKIQQELKKKI